MRKVCLVCWQEVDKLTYRFGLQRCDACDAALMDTIAEAIKSEHPALYVTTTTKQPPNVATMSDGKKGDDGE